MANTRKELGLRGENAACEFLQRQGLKLLERNWRCSYGEVDIVALDKSTLVFCEVKTRKSLESGMPEEAIDWRKQERYTKIARVFLKRHKIKHTQIRFDVVTLCVYRKDRAFLRYVPHAFCAVD
jgi:putative endonuclease